MIPDQIQKLANERRSWYKPGDEIHFEYCGNVLKYKVVDANTGYWINAEGVPSIR